MAHLGTALLFDAVKKRPIRGGAFLLAESSPISKVVDLGGGWQVELFEGARFVVARGTGRAGYSDTFKQALKHTQRGLDVLSVTGQGDLSTVRVGDERIVWWRKPAGIMVRISRVETIVTADVGVGELVLKDRNGNVVPSPPPPTPIWHRSTRYFRRSQLTDDLLDAYRNLYLAFESILNRIAPVAMAANGKPAEKEAPWLKRALAEAGKLIDLNRYAPSGSGTAEDRVFDSVYKYRNAIFHAKDTVYSVLPADPTAKKEVDAARRVLIGIYRDLAEKELNLRRASGGWTNYAFQKSVSGVLERTPGAIDLLAADDRDAISPGDPVSASKGPLAPIALRHSVDSDAVFLRTYLGATSVASLARLSGIVRLALIDKNDTVATVFDLAEKIEFGGAEEVEIQLGLRTRNRREPRALYEL